MIVLRIKEVATTKGISMHKLSRMSDINITTLQRVYHEPDYNLTMHTLDKLAQALEVHPAELFEYLPEKK